MNRYSIKWMKWNYWCDQNTNWTVTTSNNQTHSRQKKNKPAWYREKASNLNKDWPRTRSATSSAKTIGWSNVIWHVMKKGNTNRTLVFILVGGKIGRGGAEWRQCWAIGVGEEVDWVLDWWECELVFGLLWMITKI